MKFAFIDTEFTGEHAKTTLVSIGIVGMGDERFSISFNDYDQDQVTPWLRENVLKGIDESKSVSQTEGFKQLLKWCEDYSKGELISLVSAGKQLDITLVFELWHYAFPERKYFHNLYCLPDYLNHSAHFDLHTIFFLAGINPDINREEFIGYTIKGNRHDALYDAQVVRECFKKCIIRQNFPNLILRSNSD